MTAPLHIIQTIGSIAERTGGPARTIRDLAEALGRTGARVSLIAGHDPAQDDGLLPPDPALASLTLVPMVRRLGWAMPDFTAAIAATLRPGETSIVHDNGIWGPSNIAVGAAVRRHRLPLVISPHGMLEPWAMAYHRGRKRLAWALFQHRLLTRARGLFATAASEAKPIRALMPRSPIAVIANGVTLPMVIPDRPPGLVPSVLFLSRIHPKKNLIGLLDAWAQIVADPAHANWILRIAGPDEGGHAADVVRHAERLGLSSRVSFAGTIAEADKAAAFAAADLFILPSFSENFGIVVTEALSHGIPVIATTGTPWDQLPIQGCGWWVAPRSDALAGALAAALALSAAERAAMGRRGRAWVGAAFGWDGIAAQTTAFYGWLLHGGVRPDYVDA